MRGFVVVLLLLIGGASFKATVHAQHEILEVAATATTDPQQQQQWRHLLAASSKPTSLTVAGPDCIEAFYNTTAEQYANDECTFLVNQAFAATAASGCPQGGTSAGSPIHKCLQKTAGTTAAWVSYLTKCPLANVFKEGKGFSCFQEMASPADFEAYASSTAAVQPASRSGSGQLTPFSSAVLLYVAVCLLGGWALL